MGHTDYPYGVICKGIFDFFSLIVCCIEKMFGAGRKSLY